MRPGSGRADGIVDERAQRSRDGRIAEPRLCGKCGARRIDRQIGLESTPDEWAARLVAVFREVRRGHQGQNGLEPRSAYGEEVDVWACVPGCPVRTLDEQPGGRSENGPARDVSDTAVGINAPPRRAGDERGGFGDSGGPSRFFYCAKAGRVERNAGLGPEFEERMLRWSSGDESPGTFQAEGTDRFVRNFHPTVKPVAVMRWLVRLVTPPGGTVLDPFTGSGTTGIAAALEGFGFVGVERDPEYAKIAEARIGWWVEHGEAALEVARSDTRRREREAETGQLTIEG
jgi:hypothetical protein